MPTTVEFGKDVARERETMAMREHHRWVGLDATRRAVREGPLGLGSVARVVRCVVAVPSFDVTALTQSAGKGALR
jgi:hypothetical protein